MKKMQIRTPTGKFALVARAMCLIVVLCSLDHFGQMGEGAEHGHGVSVSCTPDHCLTVTSKDVSSSSKATAFLSGLSLTGIPGSVFSSPGIHPALHYLSVRAGYLPHTSNKLYQLHAAYLI